jgi:hypothetical protein
MRLGSKIYDTGAIADFYSLDQDHCFPVLLSTMKASNVLALCPHWGESGHTSLASEKHVAPKNFDGAYVCRHFAKAAPKAGGDEEGNKKKKARLAK